MNSSDFYKFNDMEYSNLISKERRRRLDREVKAPFLFANWAGVNLVGIIK